MDYRRIWKYKFTDSEWFTKKFVDYRRIWKYKFTDSEWFIKRHVLKVTRPGNCIVEAGEALTNNVNTITATGFLNSMHTSLPNKV